MFLRKTHGSRLNIFQPINDLSTLSKSGSEGRTLTAGQKNDVAIAGGQILGDEYSDHVVKARPLHTVCRSDTDCNEQNRSGIILREGTLLKSDQWLKESQQVSDGVRGAINFRNIPGTKIYALGQPTLEAVDEVVMRVKQTNPTDKQILWITLREEPIVYINGAPYCLRRERFTLRNMKGESLSEFRGVICTDHLRQTTEAYQLLVWRSWRNDYATTSSQNSCPSAAGCSCIPRLVTVMLFPSGKKLTPRTFQS